VNKGGLARYASRGQEVGGNCSHKDKAGALDKQTEVASSRSSVTIERALVVAREMLGMEVAFVSEFTEDQMLFRKLSGGAASFGWREGQAIPLTRSFCKRVVEGSRPNVVPDAQDDECAKDLDITEEAEIGSYSGVPVQLSNGHLYGMLCCLSYSPDPSLRERDEKFMNVLARLIADQLEREELQIRATAVGALLTALEARDRYTGGSPKSKWKRSSKLKPASPRR
jgi:GAF domain-containing protein